MVSGLVPKLTDGAVKLIRTKRPAGSADQKGHGKVDVTAKAIIGNGGADIDECLFPHNRELLLAIWTCDHQWVSRVARGECDGAPEPATDVEVVHDEPPAAGSGLIETLDCETGRLLLRIARAEARRLKRTQSSKQRAGTATM